MYLISIDREEYRKLVHEVTLESLWQLRNLELKNRLNVLPKYMSYLISGLHSVDWLKELEAERKCRP